MKSVEEMKRNIKWAIYFHKLSTDDKPQRALCPSGNDSWCGYNKAIAENKTYDHKYSQPSDVMLQIKSIYQALTNLECNILANTLCYWSYVYSTIIINKM